jgi:lysozyme
MSNEDKTTSERGLNLIKRWEGCVLHPYICPAGKRTIGVGHVILRDEDLDRTITEDEAMEILAKDVARFEAGIRENLEVELSQNQFDALVSFTFNVGVGGLKGTKIQRACNAGEFDKVPELLLEWCKFKVNGEVRENIGLKNRRRSEGELFASSEE